jgi:uncharacterized protein YggE
MNDTWNEFTSNRAIRLGVAAAVFMLALFLLVEVVNGVRAFGEPAKPATNVITVQGTGKAAAVPDVAQITFTVQESASTVADAQSAANKKANDAIAALKGEGIADKDVETLSYNVSPQYDTVVNPCVPGAYCPQTVNTNKIVGYQVSETIQAKVRDTSKAGAVLQDLGTLEVQNISGPDFVVDNDESITDEARAAAINDAKERASELAKQLGVHLGGVVSYSENGAVPYPMYKSMSVAAGYAEDQAAPTLPTGEQEQTVNVSITYEIR